MTPDRTTLRAVALAATPGPWHPCHHLQSPEHDASCPCGYRGSIWGADEEHVVCEMGAYSVPGEEGLSPPRYDRPQELRNAEFIFTFDPPTVLALLNELDARDAEIARLRTAISWVEPPFVDDETPLDEVRKRIGFLIADAARTALKDTRHDD